MFDRLIKLYKNFKQRVLHPESTHVEVWPEDYLGAASELLIILLGGCNILSAIVNPKIYEQNALKDRLGYNDVCVGFDTPPANTSV